MSQAKDEEMVPPGDASTVSGASLSAFTPGPWTLLEGPEAERTPGLGGYQIVVPGAVICSRNAWPHRAAESQANARLIAAAPELLAALHDLAVAMRAVLEAPDDASRRPHAKHYLATANAAIAKALGSEGQ